MPWSPSDASRFTKKATSGKSKRMFSDVANSALKRGSSEGSAIRQANSVVKRNQYRKGGRSSKR